MVSKDLASMLFSAPADRKRPPLNKPYSLIPTHPRPDYFGGSVLRVVVKHHNLQLDTAVGQNGLNGSTD
jgi:hypothetical protein